MKGIGVRQFSAALHQSRGRIYLRFVEQAARRTCGDIRRQAMYKLPVAAREPLRDADDQSR